MAGGSLIFSILLSLSVLLGFIGLWFLTSVRDPIEERMRQYGVAQELAEEGEEAEPRRRRAWTGLTRLLSGFGLGPKLARSLMRAGFPFTAAEFTVIILAGAVVGFTVGTLAMGYTLGLVLGLVGLALPLMYLRYKEGQRVRAITWQLPDALTLLVGALRAGLGLSQALQFLVDNLPPPISTEFAWVTRAISLGAPVNQALREMADRVGSDDVALVVTAINVQSEMGGNLAETLETISETVRERIRMFRQVRVLTAQQRLSGYILTAAPIFLAFWLFVTQPDYIGRLFQPGWIRLVPIGALVLQVLGFLTIRKIMNIEI
ncbi:MAG: type II secretion system F family protein [Anaerolineae bacterium]|nr:type II secretion system F family protein [Anaerolineae bacterium]